MLIELYGLPGSGKSTLAKNLIKNRPDIFLTVDFSSKLERYFYILLFIICSPIVTFRWFVFLYLNRKLFFYKLHLLSLTLAKMQKARYLKNNFVLLDEGFLQRILTVADRTINYDLLDKLLKHLGVVDYVFIMEGGNFHRFVFDNKKDNSPRVKNGKEYFVSWQKLLKKNNKIIQEYLSINKKLSVYKYDKTTKIENVVFDLLK